MLILRFLEPEKGRFRFKKRNKSIFYTSGFICNNTVFNVIELYKRDIDNPTVISLLNRYKGFVLATQDTAVNDLISDYFFDNSPYIKRALLSSLFKYLKEANKSCLYIYDDDFRFSEEWLDIASCCKKIIISGIENNDMYIFKKYCYNELGLSVLLNEKFFLDSNFLIINMNISKKHKTLEITDEHTVNIRPDAKYFECNACAEKLMSFGVPKESACAAIQVVPFKKIYIYSN